MQRLTACKDTERASLNSPSWLMYLCACVKVMCLRGWINESGSSDSTRPLLVACISVQTALSPFSILHIKQQQQQKIRKIEIAFSCKSYCNNLYLQLWKCIFFYSLSLHMVYSYNAGKNLYSGFVFQ